MPDSRTIDLIQHGIDDAADPAELSELEQRLASDPVARQLRDDLHFVNDLLEETPDEEPPSTLAADVMAQVRRAAATAPVVIADRRAERERKRTIALRFGLGIAAALAIGFILMPSMREPIDPRHAAGTMTSPPGDFTVTEFPIRGASISGSIRVSESADLVSLGVSFDSPAEREVRVEFDAAALSTQAGRAVPIGDEGSGVRTFDVTGESIEMQFERGVKRASAIGVRIRQGGDVFETTIDLGQPTNF